MGDRTGQRLDNYRLIHRLGAGSFGEVYLAEQIYRKNQVAVKVLPQMADDDLPGFLNEARTIRLRHPHIVQVLDFGVDSRTPFIVMEYITQGTLREHYPKGTQLPLDQLISYINQIADALQYAHDENLIHRDVKPENILLQSDTEVLLSDFGIATMARSSLSQSVLKMAGTLAYMAPEQIQGKPVLASDQYALGIIVYEYLCGKRPFHGGSVEVATQHMITPPPSLRAQVPTLSSDIEHVVMTALEKEPSKRFTNVKAFAYALEQAYKPLKQSVSPVSNPVPSMPIVPPEPSSPKEQEPLINAASAFPAYVKAAEFHPPLPTPKKAFHSPSQPPITSDTLPPTKPIVSPRAQSELETKAGNFVLPTSIGGKTKHRRYLYPILILVALLIIGIAGGGGYYYYLRTSSSTTDQHLQNAKELIARANREATTNPVAALQDLASAQSTLRSSLLNDSLSGTQRTRLMKLLQMNLTAGVKAAIMSYNLTAKITSLPCASVPSPTPLNEGTTGTQAKTLASVQGKNGSSLLFALGQDNKLYKVTNGNGNSSLFPFSLPSPLNTAKVLDIASYGPELAVLTVSGTTSANYVLALLAPDQKKLQATSQVNPEFITDGQTPKLIAVNTPDVYVVLASDSIQQSSATILDYAPNKTHQPLSAFPTKRSISISEAIVSMAAFPQHQLYFLLADGSVQNLSFTGNTPQTSVFVSQPIAPPLAVSANDFTWQKLVPVPTTTSGGSTSLALPGATSSRTLVAALVNNVPHLYMLDAVSHRLLDLQGVAASGGPAASSQTPISIGTPTPTSTSTNGSVLSNAPSPVTLLLKRQYASASLLTQAKSMAVDAQGSQVTVLTQTQQSAPSLLSLISFPTNSQDGCV